MVMKYRKTSIYKLLASALTILMTVGFLPAKISASGDADVFANSTGYSTYAPGEILKDSFYYTDGWFDNVPEQRNDSLALLSMQLAAAAIDDDVSGSGANMLRELGFGAIGFIGFDSDDPDDCAYTWAAKTIDDYTLVAVVVQSYAFDSSIKEKGWKQNFKVNGETETDEHFAFGRAVDSVVDGIASLGGTGKVKYWIMGQSRGGALANLIAARLPAKLNANGAVNEGIYAYTFEAPAVVNASAVQDASTYGYIHNYVSWDDPVTKVPMWGMIRYGNVYELKTGETDAGMNDELIKLNSPAADQYIPYEEIDDLIDKLKQAVPTRSDYSRTRNDSFADTQGGSVSVSYSYQDTLMQLMHVIFSGELSGIDISDASEMLNDLIPTLQDLGQAAKYDKEDNVEAAMPLYWKVGLFLKDFLNSITPNGPVSLSDSDYYALLRIIGPTLIDTDFEPTGDEVTDAILYIVPITTLFERKDSLTYDHHFDAVIARLKVLAPQPDLEDISITINDPEAGDSVSKAPDEVKEEITDLGHSWLTAEEAEWVTDGETLQDGSVYYLDLKLKAVGHLVPDDFEFTINGTAPFETPDVYYEDGASIIYLVFEFLVGTPKNVFVSFSSDKTSMIPDSFYIAKGKSLKSVERPEFVDQVVVDGITWIFYDWQDDEENYWDYIIVNQDMTVHAAWTQIIDNVKITFEIPSVGDPIPVMNVPEGVFYYVDELHIYDEHYSEVEERITEEGTYDISIYVRAVGGKGVFAIKLVEDDYYEYDGTASVNGENIDAYYEEDGNGPMLGIFGSFTVGVKPSYTVTKGADAKWTKGSNKNLEFEVKRSVDDDNTYRLFQDLEIDDQVVDPSHYSKKPGSVIITIDSSWLETLSVEKHTVKVNFEDNSVETSFSIVSKGDYLIPKTGIE